MVPKSAKARDPWKLSPCDMTRTGLRKSFDLYFICADFEAYCVAQTAVSKNYTDVQDWTKKAILNVSRSGKFSSDRTIAEYARDIGGVECDEF